MLFLDRSFSVPILSGSVEFQLGFSEKGTQHKTRIVIGLLMEKPMEDKWGGGTETSLDHDVGDRNIERRGHTQKNTRLLRVLRKTAASVASEFPNERTIREF